MYPNYNYNYSYQPFYESPEMKQKRLLRRDSNAISLAVLGFVGLSFVAAIVFSLLSMAVSPAADILASGKLDPAVELLLYLLNSVLTAAPPFLIMAKIMKIPTAFYMPLSKPKGGASLSLVVFGFGACMFAQLVSMLITVGMSGIGLKEPEFPLPEAAGIPEKIIMLIGISVFPGIVEEVICRGVILQWLRRYGDGFAILVSSIIFGLIHMNLAQIPFAMMVGIALGYIAVRTESLIIPMIVHAANNAFSLLVEWFLPKIVPERDLELYFFCMIIIFILAGLLAMFYIDMKKRGFWKLEPHRSVLSPSACFKTFWGSVGAVIMTIVVVCFTLLTYLEPYMQEWLDMLTRDML